MFISFIVGPGAIILKDRNTGAVIKRYIEGDVILSELVINPNIALNSQAIDLNLVENLGKSIRGKLLAGVKPTIYKVESGSGQVFVI
jgi:hypothetical protein